LRLFVLVEGRCYLFVGDPVDLGYSGNAYYAYYGAHPVLRVAGAGGAAEEARLVPFVAPIVRGVDLKARRIDVEWEPEY